MRDYIRKRVLDIANHILCTKHTIRQAAQVFGVSKSNVHRDMVDRLPQINKRLAHKVAYIMAYNLSERAFRSGLTKTKQRIERMVARSEQNQSN